jgi:predicted phage tail protein
MEAQSEHRYGLENRKIDADIASEKRGQVFAFILAGLAIIGSFFLIATGKDRLGIGTFITTFASLITVFIVGKVKQSWELARKRKEMKEFLPRLPELEK